MKKKTYKRQKKNNNTVLYTEIVNDLQITEKTKTTKLMHGSDRHAIMKRPLGHMNTQLHMYLSIMHISLFIPFCQEHIMVC